MKHELWRWLAPALLLMSGAAAAETGYTLQQTNLKAKPFLDADTLIKLPEKSEVEIVLRQGPWMQVKTKSRQLGYVRMLQLRLGSTPTAKDSNGWVSVLGPGTTSPRPSSTTVTMTGGVRGFSEEELQASKPNKPEYDRMKTFAASADQANAHAAQAKLTARAVPYCGEDGKPLKDQGGKK
jgi:hypothetical protein